MDAPDGFEMTGRRAFYRPVGTVSLGEAVDMVAGAIAYAREKGACEVLANVSALAGFAAPTTLQRYHLVRKWVATAGGSVRLAVVACAEMIDPSKFGVTVAVNRGLTADIFVTEAEALAWLDGEARAAKLRTAEPG